MISNNSDNVKSCDLANEADIVTTSTSTESQELTNKDDELLKNKQNEILNDSGANFSTEKCGVKTKKSVKFNNVNMYLFDRTQGFQSIPSDTYEDSITIGMKYQHSEVETFDTIDDFLKYKREMHLRKLEQEVIVKQAVLSGAGSCFLINDDEIEDVEEEEQLVARINEILDKKEVYEDIEVDLPKFEDIFCPILTPLERRAKLEEHGVGKNEIDQSETEEIVEIKKARLVNVGCKCKELNMVCGENGDLCSCASNGIPCQLDRTRYPCACTIKKCKNPNGIKRFDQKTVLKHRADVLLNCNKDLNKEETNKKIEQPIEEICDTDKSTEAIPKPKEIKSKKRKRKSSPGFSPKRKKRPTVLLLKTTPTKLNEEKISSKLEYE